MAAPLKTPPLKASSARAAEASGSRSRISDEAFLRVLGKTVRDTRQQRGLARKALAEAADISERYLAQLELGSGNISVILLRRLAQALDVRMAYLLGSEASPARAHLNSFIDSLSERRIEEVLQRLTSEFGADDGIRRKRIALIGLRGAGKSTLGRALAKSMRRPFIELDHEVEVEAGMALPEIFQLYGGAGYRTRERQCLQRIIGSPIDSVIGVGGGLVSEPDTYQLLLNNCFTVWIKASPSEHMSRVVAQGDLRPMRGRSRAMEELKTILVSRESQYGRADAVVDTSRQSIAKSFTALRAAVSVRGAR